MSKIKETVRLICVTIVANNNKFYEVDLYEDGHWDARWGRVGNANPQKGSWQGESKLRSKIKSKEKKGYVRTKTLSESVSVSNVPSGSVHELARNQIKTSSTLAEKLISRLSKANIHQITANTQITFNSSSGLFQTPLGIVTGDGLIEASELLDKMFVLKDKSCKTFYNYACNFLEIVPQNVGRKVQSFVDSNFANLEGIKKQKALLDSLEVSVKSATTKKDDKGNDEPEEKVFDVSVEPLTDKSIYKRLEDEFNKTKKSMHHYGNVKVANIYEVTLGEMDKSFDNKGWGNVEQYYHGTGIANCLSIFKSGLSIAPPSSARIAGKMFGNGVYGANCSSKSLGYSLGRWGQGASNDGAWLFVCDFAMGKTNLARGTGSPPRGFDSITALARNTGLHNDEFIVYDNAQVNIRYLIECSV
jgi:poly [ADP-ribose] polymerase